uniref:Uncharacterized protein n=1 Tax=Arundo donax TaxID=35708 RepID=A0A0A9HP59_ARUDO
MQRTAVDLAFVRGWWRWLQLGWVCACACRAGCRCGNSCADPGVGFVLVLNWGLAV